MIKENIVYIIGLILIIIGTLMNIFHLPYAEIGSLINKIAFGIIFLFMAIQNGKLKQRIKELEKQ